MYTRRQATIRPGSDAKRRRTVLRFNFPTSASVIHSVKHDTPGMPLIAIVELLATARLDVLKTEAFSADRLKFSNCDRLRSASVALKQRKMLAGA